MVNIINISLAVDQFNQILDNLDDILLGKHTYIVIGREVQLLVDTIAAHFTQVITLVGEEQVEYNLLCTCIINWICITQLTIYISDSFLLAV